MARKEMKDGIYCARCHAEMKLGILPKYEFDEGYPLHNVPAYICPRCGKCFFTEAQAHAMEARSNDVMEYAFGFERKVTVSGGSLALGIPAELADHIGLKRGQKVRVIPMARDGFIVRKMAA